MPSSTNNFAMSLRSGAHDCVYILGESFRSAVVLKGSIAEGYKGSSLFREGLFLCQLDATYTLRRIARLRV